MKAESNIIGRLNNIESVLRKKTNFKSGKALEYYVFDYPPECEIYVREHITRLAEKYQGTNFSFEIKLFNLYEMIIQLLEDEEFLDLCFDMELNDGYDYLAEQIANVIKIKNESSPIFSKIKNVVSKSSIIFIAGVGSAYPILGVNVFIRNLKVGLDEIGLGDIPVVLFYPGKYSGEDSQLFGTVKDKFHYRVDKFPCDSGRI